MFQCTNRLDYSLMRWRMKRSVSHKTRHTLTSLHRSMHFTCRHRAINATLCVPTSTGRMDAAVPSRARVSSLQALNLTHTRENSFSKLRDVALCPRRCVRNCTPRPTNPEPPSAGAMEEALEAGPKYQQIAFVNKIICQCCVVYMSEAPVVML